MPHSTQPVIHTGQPLASARAAMILIHGRNATPRSILELAGPLHHPDFAYLAPAAAGNTWYPYSFLAEIERNEPGITSGIAVIDRLVNQLAGQGIPRSRIVLLGFSQGGCLAATYAVRHPDRYGGVTILSGGLIGPPGTSWEHEGDFAGTPVFLGCSDVDAHIPMERVEESAEVFRRMGADVTRRFYPGMGHSVNDDEIGFVREIIARVAGR